MSTALTKHEATELERCEAIIESGLQTFVEVGTALMKIKDEGLYRSNHRSFEDYFRERWKMTRQRAYQLIDAAKVASDLSNFFDTPLRESHVAPLKQIEDPEKRREAFSLANERTNGRVTAKAVEAAVREVKGEPERPEVVYVPRDVLPGQTTFLGDEPGGDEADAGDLAPPMSNDREAGAPEGRRRWVALWERMAEQMISIHRAGGLKQLIASWDDDSRAALLGNIKRFRAFVDEQLNSIGETP